MSAVWVVKHKDGRYLYAGQTPRGQHQLTRKQREARRFANALEAWAWCVCRAHSSCHGLASFYRPVRLTGRSGCGCAR